jgi:FkbM family methyltransferase
LNTQFDENLAQGIAHIKAGRFPEAEQLVRSILEGAPDHPEALHTLGVLLFRTGRAADAVHHLQRAVSISPDNPTYRTNLGTMLQATGRREDAARQFEQAIRLDQKSVHAHANLGAILAELGDFDRAKTMFEQAILGNPDFAEAHKNLGKLHEWEGDQLAAASCYERATECNPGYTDAFASLGRVLLSLGEQAKAETACAQALKLDPECALALRTSAEIALLQDELGMAEVLATRAIAAEPGAAAGHVVLAQALVSAGRMADAITTYRTAIATPSASSDAYMALGNLLASQGLLELETAALPTLTVALKNGTQLVTPRPLDVMTTYVVLEHEKWFEDEVDFVNQIVRPGDQTIDVGANYGCYTLAMSLSAGDSGKVWAFEPAALTAHFLRRSLKACAASNVVVSETALSDQVGFAFFQNSKDPELSGIGSKDNIVSTDHVPTTTLDHGIDQFGWDDVRFLKIDAEGHEPQVFAGGHRLFAEQSPLVMYEVVDVRETHGELIDLFGSIGYRSYRLVPGPNVLVPFDDPGLEHVKLLNLFACKPDRAKELAARGLLVDAPRLPTLPDNCGINYLRSAGYFGAQSESINALAQARSAEQVAYRDAIGWYAASCTPDAPPEARYAGLLRCADLLESVANPNKAETWPQLTLFSRAAIDLGWGLIATELLEPVVARLISGERAPFAVPFVPGHTRFDQIDPGDRLEDWIVGGIVEAYVRNVSFSSLRAGSLQVAAYNFLRGNLFSGPEMTRRRLLVRDRLNLLPDTEANDPVYQHSPDNLNATFWRESFPAP